MLSFSPMFQFRFSALYNKGNNFNVILIEVLYVPFAFLGAMSTVMVIIIELCTCGYMLRARKNSFFNFVLNAKIHGLAIGTYLAQVIFLQEIHLLSQQGIHHLFVEIETDCNLIARHISGEVFGYTTLELSASFFT